MKLTAKRIKNELEEAKFQGEYLNISFWELEEGLFLLKSRAKSLYSKRTNFKCELKIKYLSIIAFRKFDVGIRNLIRIKD